MPHTYGIAHDNNNRTYIHPYYSNQLLQNIIDHLQYNHTYMQHIAKNSNVWRTIGHSKH